MDNIFNFSRLEAGYMGVLVLVLLLILRTPIGAAMGVVSFFSLCLIFSPQVAWGVMTAVPFDLISDWSLTAVPMFLLMGFIAAESGITGSVFSAMRVLLAGLPGSLAVASVNASALFAAASGSSVATAAAMSRFAVPEMLRLRYDGGLATGTVAAAGTLGAMIPPSILMILYGMFAEVSVGRLFASGFVPGILTAVVFSLLIMMRVYLRPSLAPSSGERFGLSDRIRALGPVWPLAIIIVGVLGGIFSGIVTPTEAGAFGAALTLLVSVITGRFSLKGFGNAVRLTAEGTAQIFIIVVGAGLFARYMALTGVPQHLSSIMLTVGSDPIIIILQICVVYLILGCFIDSLAIMMLTMGIFLPILQMNNIDLIWFGIITIKLLEVGLVTPPFGLNVFVIKTTVGNDVSVKYLRELHGS